MAGIIDGVRVRDLMTRPDDRGSLTEFFRATWSDSPTPVQWNVVTSRANVLRGVHVHLVHVDQIVVIAGEMHLGLVDLRPDSPTFGATDLVRLEALQHQVEVPVGVGHGFYFASPSTIVYGVTHYWDPADELGCRWDDPDLGIAWPCTAPELSPRDQAAGSLRELARTVADGLDVGQPRSRS